MSPEPSISVPATSLAVRVELYANGINGTGASGDEARAATDYTARVILHCAGVAVPLEVDAILWQRCINLEREVDGRRQPMKKPKRR